MTAKMGNYTGDQLFYAIYCDKNPTTVHVMYFHHHKVEATQVINVLPCILIEERLTNPHDLINRSGIKKSTMGKWDKEKCTFTNINK